MPEEETPPASRSSPYLTISELADRLRVTKETVRHWRKRDYLPPAFKFGRRVMWAIADIERWEMARKEKAERKVQAMRRLGEYFRSKRH